MQCYFSQPFQQAVLYRHRRVALGALAGWLTSSSKHHAQKWTQCFIWTLIRAKWVWGITSRVPSLADLLDIPWGCPSPSSEAPLTHVQLWSRTNPSSCLHNWSPDSHSLSSVYTVDCFWSMSDTFTVDLHCLVFYLFQTIVVAVEIF